MSDWTSGYVADIGYTFGYYAELNPLRARLALLNNGIVCPEFETACELGFGQGVSTNFHAAGSNTQWYGTDFNPSQAGFAQELAKVSGADAKLYDDAFLEFCNRSDLPDFDFIGLHGIWSWVSDENRKIIVDFIRRKLKVGGILYVSYNTLPGWASFAPMRHLMVQHSEVIGSEGRGTVSRVDGALNFAEKLLETNPIYSRLNSQVSDRLQKLKGQDRFYLAHEYFNKDWHPMHFSTMAEWLEPAKLEFACSAHYVDHVASVNLTQEQQEFMRNVPDPMLRQSVRDFMVNQQFRRDYWVKGARKMSTIEQNTAVKDQRVVLINNRSNVSLKVSGSLGQADMNEGIYNPILDSLSDHKIKSIGQIQQELSSTNISFAQIVQAVMILSGTGQTTPVQNEKAVSALKKQTDSLNTHILSKACSSGDIAYLASPIIGGGIPMSRFPQLFLLALKQGKKQPAEWAQFAWEIISLQGQKLVKDGKTLESVEENLAELNIQAQKFSDETLEVLRALQIA